MALLFLTFLLSFWFIFFLLLLLQILKKFNLVIKQNSYMLWPFIIMLRLINVNNIEFRQTYLGIWSKISTEVQQDHFIEYSELPQVEIGF